MAISNTVTSRHLVFTCLFAAALYKCRKNQNISLMSFCTFCIDRNQHIYLLNVQILQQFQFSRSWIIIQLSASCSDRYPVGATMHFASVYGSMWISLGNFIVTHANPNVVRALSVNVKISYAVNLDRWRRTSWIFQIAYVNICEGIYSCLFLFVTSSRPLSHGTLFFRTKFVLISCFLPILFKSIHGV